MYTGWIAFAGSELANTARARAYADRYGVQVACPPCDGLEQVLGWPYYETPEADDAPWWDPSRPESGQLLGVWCTGADGFQSAPTARTVTDLPGGGGILSGLRTPHREVRLQFQVLALGDCAASYALGYLSAALKGRLCRPDACGGDVMCMYACCPGCTPPSGADRLPGEQELRTMYDVGVIDGPSETAREYLPGSAGCGPQGCDPGVPVLLTVEVTLALANPWIYCQPTDASGGWVDLSHGSFVPDYDPDAIYAQCASVAASPCPSDPNCPPPPFPFFPALPANACYPTGAMAAQRTLLTVAPDHVPDWWESVPVVTIETGETDLRRLTVRFYSNPLGIPCTEQDPDPCSACADLNIAYLPKRSTVVLDGRQLRASMSCPGGSGRPVMTGPQGSSFSWPVFGCGGGWCVELVAQSPVDGSARVRVEIAARVDAA